MYVLLHIPSSIPLDASRDLPQIDIGQGCYGAHPKIDKGPPRCSAFHSESFSCCCAVVDGDMVRARTANISLRWSPTSQGFCRKVESQAKGRGEAWRVVAQETLKESLVLIQEVVKEGMAAPGWS
jgi:hypothetical protein